MSLNRKPKKKATRTFNFPSPGPAVRPVTPSYQPTTQQGGCNVQGFSTTSDKWRGGQGSKSKFSYVRQYLMEQEEEERNQSRRESPNPTTRKSPTPPPPPQLPHPSTEEGRRVSKVHIAPSLAPSITCQQIKAPLTRHEGRPPLPSPTRDIKIAPVTSRCSSPAAASQSRIPQKDGTSVLPVDIVKQVVLNILRNKGMDPTEKELEEAIRDHSQVFLK